MTISSGELAGSGNSALGGWVGGVDRMSVNVISKAPAAVKLGRRV